MLKVRNLMQRMKLSAVLCLLILCAAGQAVAADITLRYANFPPAGTFPCVQMEHWIAEVQRLTGGKAQVNSFPAGTLVDARSMVRGVMRGQADIGCLSVAYFPGMFPLTSAFELPLGFRSAEQASRLLMQALLKFQPEELAKVKILTAFTSPPSQIFSRKPVTSLADIQGLRLRSSGILADEVALFGGSPVSMPQSEAPDAIQRGAVDGVFTSLDVLKDLNFAESCRHGLLVDMSVYPFLVIMNKKVWESLPEDVRRVMDELALPTAEWTGRYVDEHGQKALAWGRETYGIQYKPLPEDARAAALATVASLVKAWEEKAAAKNLPAAAMLEFIRTGLR